MSDDVLNRDVLLNSRAYSLLEVKRVDDERREIRGIATTPTPDRMGDIVEPLGITFAADLPLLHQHDARRPVGRVKFHKATKDGIEFEATIAKVEEPPALKDRVDTAWGEVKAGLVRGVSIGFRPIEMEPINPKDPWGGQRFTKSEVLELSLVTVPANQDATINEIRRIDIAGLPRSLPRRSDPPVRQPANLLKDTEARLKQARAKWDVMHSSTPGFHTLGIAVSRLEQQVEDLRREQIEREIGIFQDPRGDQIAELRREIEELKARKAPVAFDGKAFGHGILDAVKGYLDPAVNNLHKRIDEVVSARRLRRVEAALTQSDAGFMRQQDDWMRKDGVPDTVRQAIANEQRLWLRSTYKERCEQALAEWELAFPAAQVGRDARS